MSDTWGGDRTLAYEHQIAADGTTHMIRVANDWGTADPTDVGELWLPEACPYCAGVAAAIDVCETISWRSGTPNTPNRVRDAIAFEIRRQLLGGQHEHRL